MNLCVDSPTINIVKNLMTTMNAGANGTNGTVTPLALFDAYFERFKNQQQDSSEYLEFLLNELHEGEIRCTGAKDSIISKLFGGMLTIRDECSKCKTANTNTQNFNDIKMSYPQQNSQQVAYTAQSLFDAFFSPEAINRMCAQCNEQQDFERISTIDAAPQHLILTIKNFERRGNVSRKLLNIVDCNKQLTVMVRCDENFRIRISYRLYAVIVHSGSDIESGHYYTYAANSADHWMKFDDCRITRCSFEEVNDAKSAQTPYILLYKYQQKELLADTSSEWAGKIQ